MERTKGDSGAVGSPERLKIVRTLPSSKKVILVQVIKNGVPQKLALEETSRGLFRDQKRHFWTMTGGDELVSA